MLMGLRMLCLVVVTLVLWATFAPACQPWCHAAAHWLSSPCKMLDARQTLTRGGILARGCHCRPRFCLRPLVGGQLLLKDSLSPLLRQAGPLMLRYSLTSLGTLCLIHDEASLHEPYIVQLAGGPCSHVALCQLPCTASKLLQSDGSVATNHPAAHCLSAAAVRHGVAFSWLLLAVHELLQSGTKVATSRVLHTVYQLMLSSRSCTSPTICTPVGVLNPHTRNQALLPSFPTSSDGCPCLRQPNLSRPVTSV